MYEILEGLQRGFRLVKWVDVAYYGVIASIGIMGLSITINRPFIRMVAEEVGKRDAKHAATNS